MDSELTLRYADFDDIDAMAELLSGLFSLEADFTADRTRQLRGLRLLLESDAVIICADIGGEVVGMITMQYLVSTAMGSRSALVEDVVIRSDVRRQGVGSALMQAALDRAAADGCRRLQLVADEANLRAHSFYRKQGWKSTNLRGWMYYYPESISE